MRPPQSTASPPSIALGGSAPVICWAALGRCLKVPSPRRACEEAARLEHAEGGGRAGLHLVVLGHVDAGKSTLMGRLLHDLGLVDQRTVHKNQKEAAQAGKVQRGPALPMRCTYANPGIEGTHTANLPQVQLPRPTQRGSFGCPAP